jgi:hypothetical protein
MGLWFGEAPCCCRHPDTMASLPQLVGGVPRSGEGVCQLTPHLSVGGRRPPAQSSSLSDGNAASQNLHLALGGLKATERSSGKSCQWHDLSFERPERKRRAGKQRVPRRMGVSQNLHPALGGAGWSLAFGEGGGWSPLNLSIGVPIGSSSIRCALACCYSAIHSRTLPEQAPECASVAPVLPKPEVGPYSLSPRSMGSG